MCLLKCSPKQCLPIIKVCRIDKLMYNINIAYTKWPLSVTLHRTIIALDSVIHFIIITRKVVGCSCGFSDLQGSVYHSIQYNTRPFLHLFTFWPAPDHSKSSRIMCTIGGLARYIGRYIGRLSTDYRPLVSR